MSPTLLIVAGTICVACAIAYVVWPLLRDDMARQTVANDNRPDATTLTLMVAGPAIWLAAIGGGIWLAVTA